MELRQLEYFVAVAEEANFTRAAARVHVAQPGVSAQVRRLERELGQDLLDRSGRTVRLTAAGAAVLPYARAALSAAAGARLAVDELTGLLRGHVTIGTLSSMASDDLDLPGLIAGFHADHPAVEISLTAANTDDLIEGLKTGRLDMAFISIGATAPPGLGTHVVTSQPFVAAVSHDHAQLDRAVGEASQGECNPRSGAGVAVAARHSRQGLLQRAVELVAAGRAGPAHAPGGWAECGHGGAQEQVGGGGARQIAALAGHAPGGQQRLAEHQADSQDADLAQVRDDARGQDGQGN
jgi:DNA-binding transcriptional LysR family regulator